MVLPYVIMVGHASTITAMISGAAMTGGAFSIVGMVVAGYTALRLVRSTPPDAHLVLRFGFRGPREITYLRGAAMIGGAGGETPAVEGVGAWSTWQEFVEANLAELSSTAGVASFAIGLPRHQVADVLDDAVIAVAEKWPKVRAAENGPLSYARGIIWNKARDHGKRRRTHPQDEPEPLDHPDAESALTSWISTENEAIHVLDIERMLRAVRELPPGQRDAVIAVKLQDLDAQDAAEDLGTTPHAVSQAIHKAMKKLRTALNDDRRGR